MQQKALERCANRLGNPLAWRDCAVRQVDSTRGLDLADTEPHAARSAKGARNETPRRPELVRRTDPWSGKSGRPACAGSVSDRIWAWPNDPSNGWIPGGSRHGTPPSGLRRPTFDGSFDDSRPVPSVGAGGGNRTHTGGKPHGILSPARLPVSPLRHWLELSIVQRGPGSADAADPRSRSFAPRERVSRRSRPSL